MDSFQIQFLGAGSAFTVGDDNYQSNVLITAPSGKRLLLDCGSDARFSLHELGLKPTDIDAVYISHPHADHIGGLEWLAFSTCFLPNRTKPKLQVSRMFVNDLWNKSLAGGLESIEGEMVDLDYYFEVKPVRANGAFVWEGIRFQLVQVVHIMNSFSIVPSFGLMFTLNGQRIFFTSDTQFSPKQISKFYQMSDLILHDCETSNHASGVHAHYRDLCTLPPEIKRKMWLYHYQPGNKPNARGDGFAGFVCKHQVFEFAPTLEQRVA